MTLNRPRRSILVVWLIGFAVLCVWVPHVQGAASAVFYGWAWSVVWHPAPYPAQWGYALIDYRLILLTLAAWTAILGAAFLVARGPEGH